MAYCRQCGAKLPEDANFCPACGSRVVPEVKPIERHRALKVIGKPKVVVTNFAAGSVEVKAGDEGEVTVDLDLRVPEDLDCNVSQDGDVVTVRCRGRLRPWSWPSYIFGSGPRANIYVSVPVDADLDLETRAGRLFMSGVNGTIIAESSAGTIDLQDCEGTVKARTRAGSVNLENVNGTVSARSSAGSIKFTGALSKSENWFRTSVGSIQLMLQGEPDLTVEAYTNLGRVTCIPELANASYMRGRYTGRIGVGTGRLIAETKTGSITIRQQK
jgi:hypothetical protein